MKKLAIVFLTFFIMISTVTAADTKMGKAIKLYKAGNYLGALDILEELVIEDNEKALVHYYLAMTYVHIGDTVKANAEYDKVITLSTKSQLADYAKMGKNNLSGTTSEDVKSAIESKKNVSGVTEFLSEQAKTKLEENKINNVIKNINQSGDVSPKIYKDIRNFDPSSNKSSNDAAPTQEEIAQAMKTLSKAGINPAASYNPYSQMNPEMMQMNMLMSSMGSGNNNSNNSAMNMMPMLMMMQNGQGTSQIDQQLLQTMMSSMMMPDMNMYGNSQNNY